MPEGLQQWWSVLPQNHSCQDINKNILILYTTTYTDATDAIARSPPHDLFVAYNIGLGLDYSSWSDRLRRDELIASVKWLASIERSGYRVGCICVRGTYTHVCLNIYRKQRSKTNIFLLISRKLWIFGNSEQHRLILPGIRFRTRHHTPSVKS